MVEVLAGISKASSIPINDDDDAIFARKRRHLFVHRCLEVLRNDANRVPHACNNSCVFPDVRRSSLFYHVDQVASIATDILLLVLLPLGDVVIAEVDEILVEVKTNGKPEVLCNRADELPSATAHFHHCDPLSTELNILSNVDDEVFHYFIELSKV